jgi:hypothetical protein
MALPSIALSLSLFGNPCLSAKVRGSSVYQPFCCSHAKLLYALQSNRYSHFFLSFSSLSSVRPLSRYICYARVFALMNYVESGTTGIFAVDKINLRKAKALRSLRPRSTSINTQRMT